jgi:hypothetical protein
MGLMMMQRRARGERCGGAVEGEGTLAEWVYRKGSRVLLPKLLSAVAHGQLTYSYSM